MRCLRLLKPYSKKSITEDEIEDDNDDDDEDDAEAGRALPAEGRIMEQDMLSQAYHIGQHKHSQRAHLWSLSRVCGCCFYPERHEVVFCAFSPVSSCGSKGIPQSGLKCRMNIGRLEARMICRRLEKEGVIKVRPTLICHSCSPHFQFSQLDFGTGSFRSCNQPLL